MISSFHIHNFRSIVDLTVDFVYKEGKAPNHYEEMDLLPFLQNGKERLSPTFVIYGANAAGKTNVIRALLVLHRLVQLGLKPEHGKIYDPNLLQADCTWTEFEISTCIDRHDYTYRVKYDANAILEESLVADDKEIFHVGADERRFRGLLTAVYTKEKWEQVYHAECCPDGKTAQFTFFQRAAQNYGGISEALRFAYESLTRKLLVMPANRLRNLAPGMWKVLAEEYGGDEALQAELARMLRQFDIGIKGLSFRNDIAGNGKVLCSHHVDSSGREVVFDFGEESDGTNELLWRIVGILLTFRIGGVMVVDELDSSIHPLVLRELVRMMRSRRFNERGDAQFVFTAHATDLLESDVLRLSDVAFVRKNATMGTQIKNLMDFKDAGEKLRNDSNWRTKYLEGWYSGIPNAAI